MLNSLLVKLSFKLFGEGEVQAHLPSFLMAILTPQVVFWSLRTKHRGLAFLAGLLTTLHFHVDRHGVEARGYSGAILFCTLSSFLFARILRYPTVASVFAYVLASIAAAGFISTCILVPFSHGIVATVFFLRHKFTERPAKTDALSPLMACVWVSVGFLVSFGISVPQTLDYAKLNEDHLRLGLELFTQASERISGTSSIWAALVFGSISLVGWTLIRDDWRLSLAFLTPGLTSGLLMLTPGATASARLFCFLIVPAMIGLASSFWWLYQWKRPTDRVILVILMLGWAYSSAMLHLEYYVIGTPALKQLGAEAADKKIFIFGPQADLNVYYFPNATYTKNRTYDSAEIETMSEGADMVVQGHHLPTEPDEILISKGFRFRERMPSYDLGCVSYMIYDRIPTSTKASDEKVGKSAERADKD